MGSRKRPPSQSESTVTHLELIPLEISQLIKSNSVRIPEPMRFFAKEWIAMLPLVSDQVRETGGAFKLRPALFHSFMDSLRLSLRLRELSPTRYCRYRPSDLIAEALCSAAEDFSSGANDGAVSLYLPFRESLEYTSKETDATSNASKPFHDPKIEMALEVKRDGSNPPELTISMAGEPVKFLIDFNGMPADSSGKTAARMDAKRIWEFVSKRLAVRFGTERPHRGKPESDLGHDVAWMHDHAGLSWPKIAKMICKKQHQHTESCERNPRKLAQQYYSRQKKRYLAEAHNQQVNRQE
jgi:hypothetical protein